MQKMSPQNPVSADNQPSDESLSDFASPEIAEAWNAEIAQRLADYESAKVVGIPAEEVHAEVQRRIGSHNL